MVQITYANMLSFIEIGLILINFTNSLIASAVSISILEMQKNYSVSEYGEVNKLNYILGLSHDVINIPLYFCIAYILAKFRKFENIDASLLLLVPMIGGLLNLTTLLYADAFEMDFRVYIVLSLLASLIGNVWLKSLTTELVMLRSRDTTKMFLYLNSASFSTNIVNIVVALSMTEYQMCWYIAPTLMIFKLIIILTIIIHERLQRSRSQFFEEL